jgi:hypothetical protein
MNSRIFSLSTPKIPFNCKKRKKVKWCMGNSVETGVCRDTGSSGTVGGKIVDYNKPKLF